MTFADNSETVRLIDGPSGILAMLQEEGALPKGPWRQAPRAHTPTRGGRLTRGRGRGRAAVAPGSDQQLLQKMHEVLPGRHPSFRKVDPRRKQAEFCIAHYAAEVNYNVNGFLGRNRSAISPDLTAVMETSNVRAARPRRAARRACVRPHRARARARWRTRARGRTRSWAASSKP